MQFLENSVIGLRSAVYDLAHADRPETFVLVPMVHIGAPKYYEEVTARLSECTHIAFEGIRTPSAWLLTKAYTLAARRRALGLVTQRQGLDISRTGAKLIHADMTAAEFTNSWRQVPLGYRLAISALAPLYGAYQFCVGSRQSLVNGQSVEDLKSRGEVVRSGEPLERAIGTDRDRKLIETIEALLSQEEGCRRIGVVWGAAHMPAVAHYLLQDRGYRIGQADWIQVL